MTGLESANFGQEGGAGEEEVRAAVNLNLKM
jgi:hypothetical protein